jgi:predicted DNA-binding transcriptional regulator AlpA
MRQPRSSMPSTGPSLVTDKEVAEILQISVRHLHRLKSRGDFIHPIKIGTSTRWDLEEVQQWIRNRRPSPVANNGEGERRDG